MTILTMSINFTLLGSVKAYAASWKSVKDAGFSTSAAYYTSIATAGDGTPYVAYQDVDNGGRVTVKKYDGNSWTTIENEGFSANTAHYTAMAIDKDGAAYVAYMDGGNGNKATVMKYSEPTEASKVELSQTGTYIFQEQTEGYSSTTPASVTITKAGSGHITNLNVVLNGKNVDNFELGALSSTTLDDNTVAAKFTIQTKDNLAVGTYTATVNITSNENVSESFDVSLTVIPDISNDVKLPVSKEIIVEDETLVSEIEQEKEIKAEVTTLAAVRIEGSERVDNILEAKLLTEDGTKINTYSGVTYKWYRLFDEESENVQLVGTNENYKLVDSDEGKYIKLEAYYDGNVFKEIILKMIKKPLRGMSSSSKTTK